MDTRYCMVIIYSLLTQQTFFYMRTFFTLITFLFLGLYTSTAQVSFSDNFDSYTDGAYLGSSSNKWTTWGNAPGTPEDAKLSSEQAKSGTLSAKIFSTAAAGGPMDVVLPFGGRYTFGGFKIKMSLYVPSGKSAYFNYQATATPGQTWALDVNFNQDGSAIFSNGNAVLLSTVHQKDVWFDVEMEVNFGSNVWIVKINDNCVGSFSNPTNSLGSINFYPRDNKALYYVDDVSFDYDPDTKPFQVDAGVTDFIWKSGKLAGMLDEPTFSIRNNGNSKLTSASLNVQIGSENIPFELEEMDLAKGQSEIIYLPEVILAAGKNEIIVTLDKINGQPTDENVCNNISIFSLNGVVPAPSRAVLVEEGTGTWCVWCPRGAVFMDKLSSVYKGLFIPIAVHNGSTDPMLVPEYNTFMAFSGYPSSKVNRGSELDPAIAEDPFLTEIAKPAAAQFLVGSKYDESSKTLDISVEVEFLAAASGNHFVSLVLAEDDVKGTTSGYNQANAYAGGGNGPMGGYELLSNPVPASQMVYDHVARAVSGLRTNADNSFTGTYAPGDKVVKTFSFELGDTWKKENMHIIPILMKGSAYVNAATVTVDEALANGFVSSADNIILSENDIKVYPNPSKTTTNIDLSLAQPSQVEVQILTLAGSTIIQKNYGTLSGDVTLPINLFLMNSGIYLVKVKTDAGTRIEKLIVE